MSEKAYALFQTQSDAQRLHRVLREREISHDVSPTPRDLSRSCGMALRFSITEITAVSRIAESIKVPIEIAKRG
ncbi:MAG: DUF3343 domain-containing protein [Synergistota bacterium]|nr:DUF3343 domain-containing protein [Synergistota bacterium]